MADNDFEVQLKLEAAMKQKEENGASAVPTYTDPNDGTVYEWDSQKQAWFPKIDDNFIASYQANYQYQEAPDDKDKPLPAAEPSTASAELPKKGEKRKPNDPCWFEVDDDHNTNVYVSGLPLNTTENEFIELMSKCGLIMKDPDNNKFKIKLYRNSNGSLKGDGRCCYIKVESVGLALDILDGSYFKNKIIHVERAQFELKGTYDPSKKPKKKKAKDKEKLKRKLDKLFDWRPDKLKGERGRNEQTVIIKNMFDVKEFEEDATLILEYQKDVREECSKCGDVKKVVVYDRNPDGVISVSFATPEMADECVKLMNGRWFAGRQLTAETWDGKTKYKIIESEEERKKRLDQWENFLQGDENKANPEDEETENIVQDKHMFRLSDYELAGDTESSGDSDNETVPVRRTMGPIMNSAGSFSYSRS